ncbi:MAG: hypothetical protein R3F11_28050 [Verrucomicrobiales bacterium]
MSAPDLIVSKLADPEYLYLLISSVCLGRRAGDVWVPARLLLKDSRFCLIASSS